LVVGRVILADVMDELAARIDTIDGLRVHAFPPDNVHPPAAIVTYPDEYMYDKTFGRGMDRLTIPVVVLVGKVSDRKSRDQLGAYVDGSGPRSIKGVLETATYLDLPTTAAFASTPDHADFDTDTVDIKILVAPTDWTPAGLGMHLIGQEDINPQTDKAWTLSVHPNGRPRLAVYSDGTTVIEPSEATAATGFADGTKHWLRAQFVGNFAGFRIFNYFVAADNGTLNPTWSQLGSQIATSGAVTLHNSSQPLRINGPIFPTTGKVYYAEVRNQFDGPIIANPDFRNLPVGTTSFKDSTGKVWTVNGTAEVVSDPSASPSFESFDTARVTGAEFDIISMAGVDHVAATLSLDIAGTGA